MEVTMLFLITVSFLYAVQAYDLTQPNLTISIHTSGTYDIFVRNKLWFSSAPTFFNGDGKTYSTGDGTLILNDRRETNGSDKLGSWNKTSLTYLAGLAYIDAEYKTYKEHDCILFAQRYRSGADETRAKTYDEVISGFPGIQVDSGEESRGFLSFAGLNFGSSKLKTGRWGNLSEWINSDIDLDGGPLVIFDENENAVIWSPYSQFMAASSWRENSNGRNIYWGIMGGVNTVPSGYQYDTILFYGNGINEAFNGWGNLLRKWYGRSEKIQENDVTINYLGYWTDRGAYYNIYPEEGRNYEETVIDIKSNMDKLGITYSYFQYDSWWYYLSQDQGVKTWEPRPDVFPHGFSYILNKTQIPAVLNNRYWSHETTYAIQNNGQFSFLIDGTCALPTEENFWQYLFSQGKKWGMILYQQDWLDEQFNCIDLFKTNLDLGRRWLMDMKQAANMTKTNIQFSRSYPRHVMQALEMPFVTQARVSEDYTPGGENWRIGITSMFAHALRIAPFKDTFWTSKSQPEAYEPYPELHALVATLSTGPVGPGDMIGKTNVTLLRRCCSTNGMILKPQKPATAINRQIKERAFNGSLYMELWTTKSVYDAIEPGILQFVTLLAVDTPDSFVVQGQDLGIINNGEYMVFEYSSPDKVFTFNSSKGLKLPNCTESDFCLYHFIPKFKVKNIEMILLGEVSKWVPISPKRIQTISVDGGHFILELSGQPGESVTITLLMDGKLVTFTCTMGPSGGKSLWIMEGDCEP